VPEPIEGNSKLAESTKENTAISANTLMTFQTAHQPIFFIIWH
jgi:hypothetical protein